MYHVYHFITNYPYTDPVSIPSKEVEEAKRPTRPKAQAGVKALCALNQLEMYDFNLDNSED